MPVMETTEQAGAASAPAPGPAGPRVERLSKPCSPVGTRLSLKVPSLVTQR